MTIPLRPSLSMSLLARVLLLASLSSKIPLVWLLPGRGRLPWRLILLLLLVVVPREDVVPPPREARLPPGQLVLVLLAVSLTSSLFYSF